MRHTTPIPGQKAPALRVETLDGPAFDLLRDVPEKLRIIFFYRGAHCPICKTQLEQLSGKVDNFAALGIKVHSVSMDNQERAEKQKRDWSIGDMPIGYGLTETSAREWGLFISQKAKEAEPERFAEPGIAILYPDGTIYALYLQNVPFARPPLDGLLKGVKFIIDNDYPIRGSVAA